MVLFAVCGLQSVFQALGLGLGCILCSGLLDRLVFGLLDGLGLCLLGGLGLCLLGGLGLFGHLWWLV